VRVLAVVVLSGGWGTGRPLGGVGSGAGAGGAGAAGAGIARSMAAYQIPAITA
jgi:hypothetical protein